MKILDAEKKDLKRENASLRNKLQALEHSPAARQDDDVDSDVREKMHKLTEDRRRIEDDLKEMRSERDDFRHKFEQANDELQKMKGTLRTSIRPPLRDSDDSIRHDARLVTVG